MPGALGLTTSGADSGAIGALGQIADQTGNPGMDAISDRSLAISRAMRRLQDMKASSMNLPAMGFAAGMMGPTRSGSIGESVSNALQGATKGAETNLGMLNMSEEAQGRALENQMRTLNLAGFRNLQSGVGGGPMTLGGALNAAGVAGPSGGTPGAAGYPVPPAFNMVNMAQQARLYSSFPAGMEIAKSLYTMIEKGMGQTHYLGIDGGIYPVPGALLTTGREAFATELGKTAAGNQGNVTIPSSGGFRPGLTSLDAALREIDPGVSAAPAGRVVAPSTGTGSPSPRVAVPYQGTSQGQTRGSGAGSSAPPVAGDTVGGVARPARGGPLPDAAPSAATPGLPSGPSVTKLNGQTIITMPSPDTKAVQELGGYKEEAGKIGEQMGDWYTGMLKQYDTNLGTRQYLDNGFRALQQFRSGVSAPFEANVARWLRAFGQDPDKLKLASPGAVDQLNKDMTNMVFAAIRHVSSRPAYQEFQMLQQAYPNQTLQPEANMAILKALVGKMDWENQLFEYSTQWRQDHPGRSMADFIPVYLKWVKANPIPRYEDDALAKMIQAGGVRGVRQPGELFNDPARRGGLSAIQGGVMQPNMNYHGKDVAGKDITIRLGSDGQPRVVNPDGSLGNIWKAP
jgi:hypothetical protein